MKLTSVELHPKDNANVAVLSFRDPGRKNPLNVKNIAGLDADSIVPRYYGGSGKTKFYTLSLESRQIVIRIALNPRPGLHESVSSLRDDIYRLIASSRTGELDIQFKNGNSVVAGVSGFVSKMEAPQFNKEPEVQITVDCDEPMLKAPNRIPVDVGAISTSLGYINDNHSNAPHGFIFDLEVLADTQSLIISDPNDATWNFTVGPDYALNGFLVGDIIHFSSEYNNKSLHLTRAGAEIYLADRIQPGSIWPIIFPGDNIFILATPANFVWRSIEYYPTYWGV